jgi:hypothetical protein
MLECAKCGQINPDTVRTCECGGDLRAPARPKETNFNTIAILGGCIVLAAIAILSTREQPEKLLLPQSGERVMADSDGDMTSVAFDSVKAAFEESGAKVERDYSSRRGQTIRIYLPLKVALEMTESQAATLAAATKAKLGKNAIVYIKGPGGNTLGVAR